MDRERWQTADSWSVRDASEPDARVELGDRGVEVGGLGRDRGPVAVVVPLTLDLLVGLPLLLDPGVVLEVVDALLLGVGQLLHVVLAHAEDVTLVGDGGVRGGEGSAFFA